MKNNRNGITLIALIITIIVMLILVGVTINVALNGGLFTKADNASNSMEKQTIYEEIIASMELKNNGKIDVKLTYANAENALIAERKTVSPSSSTIDENATSAVMTVVGTRGTYKYTIKEDKIIIGEEEGEKETYEVTGNFYGFGDVTIRISFRQYYNNIWFAYGYIDMSSIEGMEDYIEYELTPVLRNLDGTYTVEIGVNLIFDISSETVTYNENVYSLKKEDGNMFDNYTPTYFEYTKEEDENTTYRIYNGWYINNNRDDFIKLSIKYNDLIEEYRMTINRQYLTGELHENVAANKGVTSTSFYKTFSEFSGGDVKGLNHIGKTIIVTNTDDIQETYTLVEFD